jgi:hypothetical protein
MGFAYIPVAINIAPNFTVVTSWKQKEGIPKNPFPVDVI